MAHRDPGSERGVVFPPRRILVIDQNMEGARLLACALHLDFPQADVQASVETDTAVQVLATSRIDAVVLHRTFEHDAASLIRALRGVKDVPMIAVCEADCKEQIFAAGATACVDFDRWPARGDCHAHQLSLGAAQQADGWLSISPLSTTRSVAMRRFDPDSELLKSVSARQAINRSRDPDKR
jgi:CheY-like chemotaxis protein